MDLTKAYNPIVPTPHPTSMGGETRMFEGGGRRKARKTKARKTKVRKTKVRKNKARKNKSKKNKK